MKERNMIWDRDCALLIFKSGQFYLKQNFEYYYSEYISLIFIFFILIFIKITLILSCHETRVESQRKQSIDLGFETFLGKFSYLELWNLPFGLSRSTTRQK